MIRLQAALLFLSTLPCFSQTVPALLPLADADSSYIRKFTLKNDLRFFYGLQGNNLSLGSTRDDGTRINGDLYKNTNDYIGAGITYGWLDGDLSYSIRGTTYLKEERSNLTQFKLAFSYTRRNIIFRPYYSESKGVVVSGSDNEFESTPSLHEKRLGMLVTYLFNPSRYSYRASMYQSEYQVKTAGSFLLRLDPFYRTLGAKGASMIPPAYDHVSRFGEQAGLQYIQSPGLLVLPGYGINIVIRDTRLFISPIVFAGLGLAQNKYETTNSKGSYTSVEYAANAVLNAGYNGTRYYAKIQFNWSSGYTKLDPTYLTNSNLMCVLTVGLRFRNLK
ncbi:MAG TPA: DUF4421 family protein [Cyclobacteriaceae bacterium]